MSAEEWRIIGGTAGAYEVSDWGRVRRGDVLAVQILNRSGYWAAVLTVQGAKFTALTHRLVATAFIDNPDGLTVVNHIDGDKRNAFAENLEWVSPRANAIHAVATGLRPRKCGPQKVPFSIKIKTPHYLTFKHMVGVAKQMISPSYTQSDLLSELICDRYGHLLKPGAPGPRFDFLSAWRASQSDSLTNRETRETI